MPFLLRTLKIVIIAVKLKNIIAMNTTTTAAMTIAIPALCSFMLENGDNGVVIGDIGSLGGRTLKNMTYLP